MTPYVFTAARGNFPASRALICTNNAVCKTGMAMVRLDCSQLETSVQSSVDHCFIIRGRPVLKSRDPERCGSICSYPPSDISCKSVSVGGFGSSNRAVGCVLRLYCLLGIEHTIFWLLQPYCDRHSVVISLRSQFHHS